MAVDGRRVDIDEDDGDRAPQQGRDGRVRGRQRHDEEAVGALRLGKRAQIVVALLDGLDVVDDEIEVAVGQDQIHTPEPLGGLGPGEERDDHADGQRPPEAETPGRRARREAELLHHGQDPASRLRIDDVLPVEGARCRRDTHAGMTGDVPDGDGLPRQRQSH